MKSPTYTEKLPDFQESYKSKNSPDPELIDSIKTPSNANSPGIETIMKPVYDEITK